MIFGVWLQIHPNISLHFTANIRVIPKSVGCDLWLIRWVFSMGGTPQCDLCAFHIHRPVSSPYFWKLIVFQPLLVCWLFRIELKLFCSGFCLNSGSLLFLLPMVEETPPVAFSSPKCSQRARKLYIKNWFVGHSGSTGLYVQQLKRKAETSFWGGVQTDRSNAEQYGWNMQHLQSNLIENIKD